MSKSRRDFRLPGARNLDEACAVLDALVNAVTAADRAIAQLQGTRHVMLVMAAGIAEDMITCTTPEGVSVPGPGTREAELSRRSVASEIALATRMSDRTVQRQMDEACELADAFPRTLEALCEGRISLAHTSVILDVGTVLSDPNARQYYETAVLGVAETQAPGRTRRIATREAEQAQPEALPSRFQKARSERCVWIQPRRDGMSEIGAVLPTALALGIHHRLTDMAHA